MEGKKKKQRTGKTGKNDSVGTGRSGVVVRNCRCGTPEQPFSGDLPVARWKRAIITKSFPESDARAASMDAEGAVPDAWGRLAKHSGPWKTVQRTEERETVAKLLQFFETAANRVSITTADHTARPPPSSLNASDPLSPPPFLFVFFHPDKSSGFKVTPHCGRLSNPLSAICLRNAVHTGLS